MNWLSESYVKDLLRSKNNSLVILLALFCFCSCGDRACDMFIPEGYELAWHDEFDGDALDTSCWTAETGGHGWGNAELQYYTDREQNVVVRDGKLVITAMKEDYEGSAFTSARIKTLGKVGFKYGYVVASIKIPDTSDGLWPAFWMMGDDIEQLGWPDCGEIDILEMGHREGIDSKHQDRFLNGACHWGNPHHQYSARNVVYPYAIQEGQFHTFTCIWDESGVAMYIDKETHPEAEPYFEMKFEDYGNNEFHKDNFILLNLAVGGNFPAIWHADGITALAEGSRSMEVDYVRVFRRK